jgi:hypothetical protein
VKLSKKNALAVAPSMLTAVDLAIIEGGSEGAWSQQAPDGTIQEGVTGVGFQQYCETLPDGTQRTSLAATPPDGPAIHETKGF